VVGFGLGVVTVFKTGFECGPEVTAWSAKAVGVVGWRGVETGSVGRLFPKSHFSKTGHLRPTCACLDREKRPKTHQ
jgi:hypothetical protein